MIAALLLMAAEPMAAIDAERAFAADAQKLGQWTAFRKYATDDALMFVPEPTNAQKFLKDRKDPPVAVFWWPGRSYLSCDGTVAINTGPWVRGFGRSVGYFTTVWVKQPDGGWKWVYDAGDELKAARPEGGDIKPMVAACPKPGLPLPPPPPREMPADTQYGGGSSPDGTLSWGWTVEASGSRRFFALQWTGDGRETVIDDQAAAPPK